MDHAQVLRALALHDVRCLGEGGLDRLYPEALDQKTVALTRLAALVAIGGSTASFGAHGDEAVAAGATAEEIVDVLMAVVPVVGVPRVVAAAPRVGLALGHDLDEPFDLPESE